MARVQALQARGGAVAPPQATRDPARIAGYLADASGPRGEAAALQRPRGEAELAAILKEASAAGEAVTISAARTSLTESCVPHGGLIVSLERMTRVLEIDTQTCRARREPARAPARRAPRGALRRQRARRAGRHAEHGIGKLKREALAALVGEDGVAQMRAIKRALDPAGCLGRGNLFALAD